MPKGSFRWPCPRIEELAYELGDEFISYCLNLSVVPEDESQLTAERREVFEEISNLVTSMRFMPGPIRSVTVSDWLTTPDDRGFSLPQTWRLRSGGALPIVTETDDDLLSELANIGLQAYPYKALAERYVSTESHLSRLSIPLQRRSSMARLVLQDESFAQLFGATPSGEEISDSDILNRSVSLYFNNGNGFGLQAIMLPESILNNAFSSLLLMENLEDVGFAKFEAHLARVLRESRALARGESVEVLRIVGLHGVRLEEPVRFKTSLIRPARPTDTLMFNQFSVGGYASAVMEARRPLRVLDADADLFEAGDGESDPFARVARFRSEVDTAQTQWTTRVEDLRLACALSAPDYESIIAPVVLFEAEVNPLSHSQSLQYRLVPVAFHPQVKLDRVRAAKTSEWLDIIEANVSTSVRIAGRRLLTALTERTDATDAFVDALVAWESLLGTGSEVSFRVSAALAVLLEPVDMEARRALYRELKRLYGLRSRLVHGSADLSPAEAETHRKRACEVALVATQRVLKTAPLVPMKAEERSNRLLFGI